MTYSPSGTAPRTDTITATYSGDSTHTGGSSGSTPLSVVDPTSTEVTCSPDSLAVGEASTCTATVTDTAGSGATTPTGTVSLTSSGPGGFTGSPCAIVETSPGEASCTVTYTPSGTAPRADTITATYSGDSTHAPSSGTTTVSVTAAGVQHPTSITVTCSPDAVAVSQQTTCRATVTDTAGSGATTPTGTVTFASTGRGGFGDSPCTLEPTSTSEVASCTVTYTADASYGLPRRDTITANYGGDQTHDPSSGTTTVTVHR